LSKQDRKTDRKKDASHKEESGSASSKVVEQGKKIKEDLDKLMDEIDDVLEENAEEFVKNYVQKGGQ
jgi:prokaryotic ubiquitin-like protein Pup